MGLIRKLFLIAVFVGSTYCWLVLFDHGIEGFKDHLPTYYTRFTGEAEKDAKPGGVGPDGKFLPAPAPPKKSAPVISGGAK